MLKTLAREQTKTTLIARKLKRNVAAVSGIKAGRDARRRSEEEGVKGTW
jgi:hypothetical protein